MTVKEEIIILSASFEFNRMLKGYNKSELSKKMEMSITTLRRKVKNPYSFTFKELLKLKKIFGLQTIDEIFQIKEQPKKVLRGELTVGN